MSKSELEGSSAVLYARVSTNDHDQTNETQLRSMRAWCEARGVSIVGEYADEMTGTSIERPEFSKMIVRILSNPGSIQILLSYDHSRLTRDKKIETIQDMIRPAGCKLFFVAIDLDQDSFEGDLINAVIERVDKRENEVRKAKTKLGMAKRKEDGKHMGRPAVFMFTEDIPQAPEGRFRKGQTKTATTEYIMSFARQGLSINYVATKILGIDSKSLVHEMRPADPSNPKCRDKGRTDRWTPYMTAYHEAKASEKGSDGERVGNPSEIVGERVVE